MLPWTFPKHSIDVVRMPGDGACLFHSIAFGLRDGGSREDGHSVCQCIADFIRGHPELAISGTPLSHWVAWDSEMSVAKYAGTISRGNLWGGGIELAAFAHCKEIAVHVNQRRGGNPHGGTGVVQAAWRWMRPQKQGRGRVVLGFLDRASQE